MNKKQTFFIFILILWSLLPLIFQVYTSFCTNESLIDPINASTQRWTLKNYQQVLSANPEPFAPFLDIILLGD